VNNSLRGSSGDIKRGVLKEGNYEVWATRFETDPEVPHIYWRRRSKRRKITEA
jgi:hypothetical protein